MAEEDENHAVVSRWFEIPIVPPEYTFPPEDRRGQLPIPICPTIPVIDLEQIMKSQERLDVIHQILEAGKRDGFFQVINHGISEKVTTEALKVLREYFDMPTENKHCAPNESGWVFMESKEFAKDGIHLWREAIKHFCHPLEECIPTWPKNPSLYREVIGMYLKEMKTLSSRIFELICEGLGLEKGYLDKLSEVQYLVGNYYPPCPDPSLTLGLIKHCDPSLITILFQENVTVGLQVLHNGEWMGVSPVPNAFVVNVGNQLEIISNGRLRSVEHRAVTNSDEKGRISIATFINPPPNSIVEPAKALVDEFNPPIYKPTLFKELAKYSKALDEKVTQKPAKA